jgi:aminomethyltransferase
LKKTALYDVHVERGARIVDFGGWAMPVQYTGIIEEHQAVRHQAGLFDVSHMGEVQVRGPGAEAFLQRLLTNDVSKVADGQCQYTLMCNERGGVVDDVLLYRFSANDFLVVVNASNLDKDLAWIEQQLTAAEYDATVTDVTDNWSLLALQGPEAEAIANRIADQDLADIPFFWFRDGMTLGGVRCLVSRTGYTGEDGFEIFCAWDDGPRLWQALEQAGEASGLKLCGLGARDTLRLEARLPLYGQELDEDTSPLEAGLGMFVKLHKGDFIGRDALQQQKEQGLRKRLAGFKVTGRGIPRTGYPLQQDGADVGVVASGTSSPTLGEQIGLGFVPPALASPGTAIDVVIRGRPVAAVIVPTPFYRRSKPAAQ